VPKVANGAPLPAGAAEPFPSAIELVQTHLQLRLALSEGGVTKGGQTAADIRAFVERVQATGAVLADENERRTAQGILDYWSTELLSLPGAAEDHFTSALLAPFDGAHVASKVGESGAAAKAIEDESRELIRFAATARLWRDSGRQYGYLLVDKAAIDRAARFRNLDPDISELVTASESAYRVNRMRRRVGILVVAGSFLVTFLGFSLYLLHQRAEQAETRTIEITNSIHRILKVVSKQFGDGEIRTAAAANLIKEARDILFEKAPVGEQQLAVSAAQGPLLTAFSDVYLNVGESCSALQFLNQARTLANQLIKEDPGNQLPSEELDGDWRKLEYMIAFRIGDIAANDSGGCLQGLTRDAKEELAMQEFNLALQEAQELSEKNPKFRDSIPLVQNKVGDLYVRKNDWQKAWDAYSGSLTIGKDIERERDLSEDLRKASQKIQADAQARLGDLFKTRYAKDKGKSYLQGAIRAYSEALAIRKALAARSPNDETYQGNLAGSYDSLGAAYKAAYDKDESADALQKESYLEKASEYYEESLKIREVRAKNDPGNALRAGQLPRTYAAMAKVLKEKPDLAGALGQYRRALLVQEQLVLTGPGRWLGEVAATHEAMGKIYSEQQQSENAQKEYSAAAASYELLGDMLVTQGKSQQGGYDPRKALEAYKKGVAVAEAHPDSELQPVRERLLAKIQSSAQSVK
jgi:tetratricopeptide (TPR) repeat protein